MKLHRTHARGIGTARTSLIAAAMVMLLTSCTFISPGPSWTPAPATQPPAGPTAAAPASTATRTAIPPTAAASATAAPTASATRLSPSATPAPTPSTDALIAAVQAGLPKDAFKGLKVIPLQVPAGQRALWAVYSSGMRNWDLKPPVDHFVAIYAQSQGRWLEVARKGLSNDDPYVAAPDYVGDGGVTQVQIEPSRVWLAVEGGVGAHGGAFTLLSFTGTTMRAEVSGSAASPGVARVQDVNGDGVSDVALDASDRYVFCYACGVAKIMFQVYAWDKANSQMTETRIAPMLMGQSGHPARALTNQAVSLAEAGLWKDALAVITQAKAAAAGVKPPLTNETMDWDYGLIKLHADAMMQVIKQEGGYPLLSNVFYGDYAAAVDLMRPYSAAQVFSSKTPLLIGTVAQTWVPQLTGAITESVNAALTVKPDLAPAYFLRGWALYLADPVKGKAPAKADVDRAAALAPGDALFRQAAQFLGGTAGPTPTAEARVTRIQFAQGATAAAINGDLAAGDTDEYLLRAAKDQLMMVSVGAPRGDAVLEIYGVSDGRPLLRGSSRRATWQGVLPATQDYGIKVISVGGNTPYTLQVIIPRRIQFAPGAVSATVDGEVGPAEASYYILRASAGQTMAVTIKSPRKDVVLDISGADDGQPLVSVPQMLSAWTGKLPSTQDYIVSAVSVGAATTFTVDFVIR